MKTEKEIKKRLRELQHDKAPTVGMVDGVYLRILGRYDGKHGLPGLNEEGMPVSPFITQACQSFEKYAAKMWAELQIRQEIINSQMRQLVSKINTGDEAISAVTADIGMTNGTENLNRRKFGEERLTDIEVQNRRARELKNQLQSLKEQEKTLQQNRSRDLTELERLYSGITNAAFSTDLIIQKAREHTLQRIDVYYRSAFKRHTASELPPYIEVHVQSPVSEAMFKEEYSKLYKLVESLIESNSVEGENHNV